jgi:FkbM family methyltransferase
VSLNWLIYRVLNKMRGSGTVAGKVSYSQSGEDLIVRSIFDFLEIPAPTYIDIGAHHPTFLSNTFLFYQQGARGINIEPDPSLFGAFAKIRDRDTNLNIGIADKEGELPFYVMSAPTLNTFSEADAQAAVSQGRVKIKEVVTVSVRPINAVLEENLKNNPLDFLSIDVEGLDFSILSSLDFSRWRPKVICAETITYSERNQGQKIPEIASLLKDLGYESYADTHINTIFLDRNPR